jgi:hypothetical protein
MSSADKPKIIIDEDWKSQVEREKEQLAREKAPPKPEAERTGALPPPSLAELVTMLATQVLVSLGQAPNPFTGKAELRLDEAQHFIDLLDVLETKTKGNCTPEETALFNDVLHQLRLAFVALSGQAPPAGP